MATKKLGSLSIGQTGKVSMYGDYELHVTRVGNGWIHNIYNSDTGVYLSGVGVFEPREGLVSYEQELTIVTD